MSNKEELMLKKCVELAKWLDDVKAILPNHPDLYIQLARISHEMANFSIACGLYFEKIHHAN